MTLDHQANGASTGSNASTHPATKLRRTVEDPNGFIMCPGVYDGFSARIAISVGFGGLYMVHICLVIGPLCLACLLS